MLARLKSDGFDALVPTSPTVSTTSSVPQRRSRRRVRGISEDLEGSPLFLAGDVALPDSGHMQEGSLGSVSELANGVHEEGEGESAESAEATPEPEHEAVDAEPIPEAASPEEAAEAEGLTAGKTEVQNDA